MQPGKTTESVSAEHRTVSRVMGIIEAVTASEPGGLRLGELSDALQAPKSSVHGLAKGLVALGYLREQDSFYLSGPAIALLSARTQEDYRRQAVLEQLRELSGKWNETAMSGVLVGDSVVYVQSVESTHTLRAAVPLRARVTLWPASSGKCLLAHMPARRRASYFSRIGLEGDALKAALKELDEVKEQGYALNLGGTAIGMFGVASPIVVPGKPVTSTIAVTGPEARLTGRLEELAVDVHHAALSLAALMP
ncbi:IclR family transcriptional regulator [Pseudarthrobacter oxydans]|uniref:IclR family transcriptional regulator n=1 Tax=Pseudarthrobacter oxydans TaxID=1671 RepID=UPI003D29C288